MTGRSAGGILEDLRRALSPHGREVLGHFAIEGLRAHERALRCGTRVTAAVAARGLRSAGPPRAQRLLDALEASGCELALVDDEVVARLTGERDLGALLGLVPLPPPVLLEDVLGRAGLSPPIALVAVEVTDPGNVGALVRTALGGGAAAFVAVGAADPFHPRAVRTSMGSLFKLPICRYPRLDPVLEAAERAGAVKLGAVSRGGQAPFTAMPRDLPLAIFLGSEAAGLPAAAVARLDRQVTVPMAAGVDSFSVNAVAAVLLYEARRPRC